MMNCFKLDEYTTSGTSRDSLEEFLEQRDRETEVYLVQGRRIDALPVSSGPLFLQEVAEKYGFENDEVLEDTCGQTGSNFLLNVDFSSASSQSFQMDKRGVADLIMAWSGCTKASILSIADKKELLDLFRPYHLEKSFQVINSLGKIRAVKSAEYVYLPQLEIIRHLLAGLQKSGWIPAVRNWYYNHELTIVNVGIANFRSAELAKYERLIRSSGCDQAEGFKPALRIVTSDTGNSAVTVHVGMARRSQFCDLAEGFTMPHRKGRCSMEQVDKAAGTFYAAANKNLVALGKLLDIEIDYPISAAKAIAEISGIHKRAVKTACEDFALEQGGALHHRYTAHDVFFLIQNAIAEMVEDEKVSWNALEKARSKAACMLLPDFPWEDYDAA